MTEEDKISVDYAKFMEYISMDSRAEQLMEMYKVLQDELVTAPASPKSHWHNAFVGGYLDHVLAVVETALKLTAMYKNMGGQINFTKQELIFAALHHDLGKLGTEEGPYYLIQDSDWHRKNGDMYKHNTAIQYYKVTDRALMMLQKFGIELTEAEWLGIKLSDGLYDEANKAYYINYNPNPMKTSLPYIIHWADHMTSLAEHDGGAF